MPRGYPNKLRAQKVLHAVSTGKTPGSTILESQVVDEPRFVAIFEFDGLKRTYVCETYFDLLVLKDALQKRYGMGTVRTEGEPR